MAYTADSFKSNDNMFSFEIVAVSYATPYTYI